MPYRLRRFNLMSRPEQRGVGKRASARLPLGWLVMLWLVVGLTAGVQAADVTIGFQLVYGPWKAKMGQLKANGLGGKSIDFVRFTSGSEVINAMASGSVDISLSGSSPTAAGYSRGVDLQVIYVYDNINNAEALVVDDSITAPQDLIGKTIAVPFGSTTHFHMMFALEQFNISPKALRVLDMSPPDMVAAWERGDINGGFVWDPALGRMKERGRVLLTSGDLSNWGKATFDAMVARKGFTDANPEFTCQWIKMVSSADADYRTHPTAYGPGTEHAAAIARSVSGNPDQVGGVLALYDFPALEEQVSGVWLGGGVQNALQAASEFLVSQGKLDRVLDDYAGSATPEFAQMVLDGGC